MKPVIAMLGLAGLAGFSWTSWDALREGVAVDLSNKAQMAIEAEGFSGVTASFDHLDGTVRGVASEEARDQVREIVMTAIPAGRLHFSDERVSDVSQQADASPEEVAASESTIGELDYIEVSEVPVPSESQLVAQAAPLNEPVDSEAITAAPPTAEDSTVEELGTVTSQLEVAEELTRDSEAVGQAIEASLVAEVDDNRSDVSKADATDLSTGVAESVHDVAASTETPINAGTESSVAVQTTQSDSATDIGAASSVASRVEEFSLASQGVAASDDVSTEPSVVDVNSTGAASQSVASAAGVTTNGAAGPASVPEVDTAAEEATKRPAAQVEQLATTSPTAAGNDIGKTAETTDQRPPRLGVYLSGKPNDAYIRYVDIGSAAAEGDIRVGDQIVKFGDRKIKQYSDLVAQMKKLKAGDEVSLSLIRNGYELDRKVVLKKAVQLRPANSPAAP